MSSEIADAVGLAGEYNLGLRLLNRLGRLGEIEKWPAREQRSCYWRRLGGEL